MNYQLESANESGQEVIGHLQDTAQDPSPVVQKVDGINSQWDQLQARLRELRNLVKDKVSPERIRFFFHYFLTHLRGVFRLVLWLAFLPESVPYRLCRGHAVCVTLVCHVCRLFVELISYESWFR